MEHYVESLEIDKNLQWTPSRNNKGKLKFPDHYAILVTLNKILMKKLKSIPPKKQIIWNTKSNEGWLKYKTRTENNIEFERASNAKEEKPERILNIIDKEITKLQYACFGKVKVYSKDKNQRKLEALQAQKIKISKETSKNEQKEEKVKEIDNQMADVMSIIKSNQYERELKNLIETKATKGRSAAIFNLRDKVLGKKKTQQDAAVVINPESGENVYTPSEIKSVSLKYCVNLLSSKEPKKGYEEVAKYKEYIHNERMAELVDDDLEELPVETFAKIYNDVCKKSGSKYNLITKAGNSLKEALFTLMRQVWKSEKIPVKWQESTLIPVYKGKKKLGDLEGMRFLHDLQFSIMQRNQSLRT